MRNGPGTYTYTNGDTYEGEWVDGMRHGQGSYTFKGTGAKYSGTWVNGRKEGGGELFLGNYTYQGSFTADQPSGPGRYVFGHLDCQQNGDYVLEEKKREEDEPQDDEEPVMIPRWRGGAISINT